MHKYATKKIALLAMFAAIAILLGQPFMQIRIPMPGYKAILSVKQFPVFMSGMLLGPSSGILVAFITDVIYMLLAGRFGAFNPLFTFSLMLVGLTGGLLYKRPFTKKTMIFANALRSLGITFLLNTLISWISYGRGFSFFSIPMRFISAFVFQFLAGNILLIALIPLLMRLRKRLEKGRL